MALRQRAALTSGEYDGVMMRVNHSCAPNVGMGGNVLLVSMRDIAAGEELTIDYALFMADPGFAMECRCGTAACRGTVTGTDWTRAELQQRYRGWFSWWLQREITGLSSHNLSYDSLSYENRARQLPG